MSFDCLESFAQRICFCSKHVRFCIFLSQTLPVLILLSLQSILRGLEQELEDYLENYAVPDVILEEPEAEASFS